MQTCRTHRPRRTAGGQCGHDARPKFVAVPKGFGCASFTSSKPYSSATSAVASPKIQCHASVAGRPFIVALAAASPSHRYITGISLPRGWQARVPFSSAAPLSMGFKAWSLTLLEDLPAAAGNISPAVGGTKPALRGCSAITRATADSGLITAPALGREAEMITRASWEDHRGRAGRVRVLPSSGSGQAR